MINRTTLATAIAICFCFGCVLQPAENRTRNVSSRCNVHDVEMKRTVVPIYYGLPAIPLDQAYSAALAEATESSFPNAQESVGGGCIQHFGAPKRARIYACEVCKIAKQEWLSHYQPRKQHSSLPPSQTP